MSIKSTFYQNMFVYLQFRCHVHSRLLSTLTYGTSTISWISFAFMAQQKSRATHELYIPCTLAHINVTRSMKPGDITFTKKRTKCHSESILLYCESSRLKHAIKYKQHVPGGRHLRMHMNKPSHRVVPKTPAQHVYDREKFKKRDFSEYWRHSARNSTFSSDSWWG
jgi:hypothetical protein